VGLHDITKRAGRMKNKLWIAAFFIIAFLFFKNLFEMQDYIPGKAIRFQYHDPNEVEDIYWPGSFDPNFQKL
jgi:hypothetical protein